jgi:hypothetical protein
VLDRSGTTAHVLPAPAFAAHLASVAASRGEHVYQGFHIQNVNAYTYRLKDWLPPFKGVASRYLPSNLGWRRIADRLGENSTPERCLQAAYRCTSA